MASIRLLFLGDIVGKTGRMLLQKHIDRLKRELEVDAVIVNGENSAHGRGITSKTMKFFILVVTGGQCQLTKGHSRKTIAENVIGLYERFSVTGK